MFAPDPQPARTTTTAVNSGLRRARAQLAQALPAEDELAEPAEPDRRALLDRFAAAIENADASALAELLREDVALEMPPLLTWFTGRPAVARFAASQLLTEPGRLRLVPVDKIHGKQPVMIRKGGREILDYYKSTDTDRIESYLMETTPQPDWNKITYQLIELGRGPCRAVNPKCHDCPLSANCPVCRE